MYRKTGVELVTYVVLWYPQSLTEDSCGNALKHYLPHKEEALSGSCQGYEGASPPLQADHLGRTEE